MRPVLHGDLVAAARVLLCLPRPARRARLREIVSAAERADHYRRTTGRAHPQFGCGSLMAASGHWPQMREPQLDDPEYLHCLALVIAALQRRNRGRRGNPGGALSLRRSPAPR